MEHKRTTEVWRLIQQYMDGQVVPVKQAGIAQAIGVGRSSLSQWKYGQTTPTPENLRKLHEVTRIPYQTFLDALLVDMGYLDTEAGDDGGDTAANSRVGDAHAMAQDAQRTGRSRSHSSQPGWREAEEPEVLELPARQSGEGVNPRPPAD